MSRSCAVAFQSLNKVLSKETRIQTLGLYKSLLRSSEKYLLAQDLKSVIRDRFKSNKNLASRPRVLDLLSEADKTKNFLENGSMDDQCITRVNAYITQNQKKIKRIDIPTAKKATAAVAAEKKQVKRKPYQVAITTKHSFGFEFKRVRGWRQPVKTSMMLKNRVKTVQARLDRFYEFQSQLEMIRSEREFLRNLKCLPKDNLYDYENNIKMALHINSKRHIEQRRLQINSNKLPEE